MIFHVFRYLERSKIASVEELEEQKQTQRKVVCVEDIDLFYLIVANGDVFKELNVLKRG